MKSNLYKPLFDINSGMHPSDPTGSLDDSYSRQFSYKKGLK